MTTVATIIANGYAKSAAARIDTIAVPNELIQRIGQCLGEVFQVISREKPYLLGVIASVPFDGFGWPRPADCMRVVRVLADVGTVATPPIASGTEISVVSYDDQGFCAGAPSLTELGQRFLPTGQSVDPANGTVTMVYARAPIMPVTTADSIDPLFPAPFNDYLQYDIAAYLADKDERDDDSQKFFAYKNALMGQIIDWCKQQTYSLQQRFPDVTPPLANTNEGRQQPAGGG